jgi:glycosyltransferase involved in cell wall biosynthesis
VITSNLSCLPEAGGPGSLLIDPYSSEAMAEALLRIVNEPDLIQTMKATGKKHADLFTPDITARRVMDLYETL